ncbi:22969_t:CDS:2, partial [Cetraspora pellucida]
IPYLIVGTKIDLRNDPSEVVKLSQKGIRPITWKQGKKLALELEAIKYVECSALTQKGLKIVFNEALLAGLNPHDIRHARKTRNRMLSLNIMPLLNKMNFLANENKKSPNKEIEDPNREINNFIESSQLQRIPFHDLKNIKEIEGPNREINNFIE